MIEGDCEEAVKNVWGSCDVSRGMEGKDRKEGKEGSG
jgi:hypothetical protein